MRNSIAAIWLSCAAVVAFASGTQAAPRDPVDNLMKAAEHNYTPNVQDYEDYFSDERLTTLFSRAFADSFRSASKRAAQDDEGVFDADVITNAQDGCPLKDIKIDTKPPEKGFVPVQVTFLPFACMEGDSARDETRTVIFMVVEENGRDVVADIFQTDADKRTWSIKEQMDRYGR